MKDILTQTSINVLTNSSLSWSAKGLYLFMAHGPLPENEVTKKWLYEQSKTGNSATTSAIRELEMRGFIRRRFERDKNAKFKGVFWSIR